MQKQQYGKYLMPYYKNEYFKYIKDESLGALRKIVGAKFLKSGAVIHHAVVAPGAKSAKFCI